MIDRFEVQARVGSGAAGVVYRAHDPKLQRVVAVKVLTTDATPATDTTTWQTIDLRAEPRDGQALLREARMMARLSHPNVLPVYEVGLDRDAVFLVSEFVDGTNLREWLSSPQEAAAIRGAFAQAARGLAAAHAAGLVHGDFKPDNVLRGRDGRIRVADFGLSRMPRELGLVRSAGEGTAPYMAPELWAGQAATSASDVFAFAVSFVEAFSGERPRNVSDADAWLRARGIDRTLIDVIVRALDDDASRRPAIDTVASALEHKRGRRTWLAGIAAGVMLATVATVVLVREDVPAPACAVPSAPLAGHWDAALRERLGTLVKDPNSADERVLVGDLGRAIDRHAEAIAKAWTTTCEAGTRHEVTLPQVRARTACLERRIFELSALVRRAIEKRARIGSVAQALAVLATADQCATSTAPPPDDPDALALYVKLRAIGELPPAEQRKPYLELADEARRRGDPELATRAAHWAALRIEMREPATTDAELQVCYREANAIGAFHLAATALLERARLARVTGKVGEARALAELARELARAPTTSPTTKGRIHLELGKLARTNGERREALEQLEQGRAALAGHGLAAHEIDLLLEQARTLRDDGRYAEATKVARGAEQLARATAGEASMPYVAALATLSSTLNHQSSTRDESRKMDARLLEILPRIPLAPDHPQLVPYRSTSVLYLINEAKDYARALKEIDALIADVSKSPRLDSDLGQHKNLRGYALWGLGRYDDALASFTSAGDDQLARFGADNAALLRYRMALLSKLLQLERVAEAGRVLTQMEEAYRRRPTTAKRDIAKLAVMRALLLLERNKPAAAEAVARKAIAELAELGEDLDSARSVLGMSLLAQRRWAAARAVFADALAAAAAAHETPLTTAALDVGWARATYELGDRKLGLARLRAAHDELAKSYEMPYLRRHAARWLATYERPKRGRARKR